jgi:hypothetical protein
MIDNSYVEKIKELSMKFLKQHQDVGRVKSRFQGSGDSFGEFYDMEIYNKKDKLLEDFSVEWSNELEDLLYAIIQNDGRAYFDNDGSTGYIDIDFVNNKIKIEVAYYELVSNSDGECEYKNLLESPTPDRVEFQSLIKNKKRVK